MRREINKSQSLTQKLFSIDNDSQSKKLVFSINMLLVIKTTIKDRSHVLQ